MKLLPVLLASLLYAQAPQQKARIFIYQGSRISAKTIGWGPRRNPIFCDGVEVASLQRKWTYFVLEVAPGEHSLRGKYGDDEVIIDATPGHLYFVLHDFTPGFVAQDKLIRKTTQEGKTVESMITNGKLHSIDGDLVADHSRVSLTFTPEKDSTK
jgi:hypothetical protein